MQDVAAGNVDMLFTLLYFGRSGQIQAGKLRVHRLDRPKRSPILPDVPTMAEQGYPGIEMDGLARHRRAARNAASTS